MSKTRDILYIFLFLVLLLLLWTGLSLLPGPAEVQLPGSYGGYDLTGYDFEGTVYITAPCWESWPERLYAPEDLDSAEAPVPHQSLDYTKTQYATHRLSLTLPPGAVYAISLYSADYSMRLYIDGMEADTVGLPGETREETVPQMRDAAYYFAPQSGATEIVVQAANFVHQTGCRAPVLTVGTAESIARHTRNAGLKTGLVFGCLMTACLYHLAIFLLNRRKTASLIFSALCLLLAYISKDFPALLLPRYNWQIAIRLEYLASILAAAALAMLVRILFPGSLYKWIYRGYLALCGGYAAIVIITNSTFFSGLLVGFQTLSIGMIIYGLVALALTLREKKAKNLLAFLGIALFGLFITGELLIRIGGVATGSAGVVSAIGSAGMISTGMMFLVFCYAMVLSIEGAETDQKLEAVQKAVAEAEARYREKTKDGENGQAPPVRLSDFGLTKRETEVALLLLDGKSRAEIADILFISLGTVNTHCTRVYQKAGCGSVAEFIRLTLSGGPLEAAAEAEN